MPKPDSDSQVLADARDRARVLLDALTRDGVELRVSPQFAEGAACCEDAAEQTRRLIAELDAQLNRSASPEGQPRP